MKTKPKIEIDLEEVERLAGLGLGKGLIADALGISYSTLNRNQKESEELEAAIKRGKARSVGLVANALFDKAMGGDTTSMIFYLKCQGGFVETQRQIISEESEKQSDGLQSIYGKMREAGNGKQ